MSTKHPAMILWISKDGDSFCATYDDFKNLQESDAGFGRTVSEAVHSLLIIPFDQSTTLASKIKEFKP